MPAVCCSTFAYLKSSSFVPWVFPLARLQGQYHLYRQREMINNMGTNQTMHLKIRRNAIPMFSSTSSSSKMGGPSLFTTSNEKLLVENMADSSSIFASDSTASVPSPCCALLPIISLMTVLNIPWNSNSFISKI